MHIRHIIFLLLIALIFQNSTAQKTKWGTTETQGASDQSQLDIARFQINDIKAKGIIVRLKTDKDRITAYRKSGDNKVADKISDKDKGINLLMEYSFITQWSYCPIYFMESQYTSKLIRDDTLIAKTYDLERDTSIYMDHDSVYILDYGELMDNDIDPNHPTRSTGETATPMAGTYLVVKGHDFKQLSLPMPFHSKIWLEGYPVPETFQKLSLSPSLTDTMKSYLDKYHSTAELLKSEAKPVTVKYLDSVYKHIFVNLMGAKKPGDSAFATLLSDNAAYFSPAAANPESKKSPKSTMTTFDAVGDAGTTLERGTKRLNTFFIDYYCLRLDKDKNILSRDDLLYWWERNPNIQYLPHLPQLETWLKSYIEKHRKPTK